MTKPSPNGKVEVPAFGLGAEQAFVYRLRNSSSGTSPTLSYANPAKVVDSTAVPFMSNVRARLRPETEYQSNVVK
jgi:hypothetical protein